MRIGHLRCLRRLCLSGRFSFFFFLLHFPSVREGVWSGRMSCFRCPWWRIGFARVPGGGGGVVMDKEVDLERQLSEKLRDERTEDVVKRRT